MILFSMTMMTTIPIWDSFYDNLVYFLCEESGWSEEDLQGIGIVEMMDIAYELGAGEKLGINKENFCCSVQ